MVSRVNTVTFEGVDVRDIDVQVQVSPGLPQFNIVGANYPRIITSDKA